MQKSIEFYDRLDIQITTWLAKYGVQVLRISLGIIFFWFGILKFFPGLSPAQDLATGTIEILTFGLITPSVSIIILAIWECLIGIGLIFGVFLRGTLLLLILQMIGTVTPIVFFPELVFTQFPYGLTLEGQYIIKNLVLISAGMIIGATVRNGRIVSDPDYKVMQKAIK